jgi:hypothetical protein
MQIVIKIALSTANRNRVSILRYILTTMRRADNGGQYEHKRQFFTKDLVDNLYISKSTARRNMKELQVLGVSQNWPRNDKRRQSRLLYRITREIQLAFRRRISGFDKRFRLGRSDDGR